MSEPKRLVIYHGNCLDGFTAAWAARESLKGIGGGNTEYIAANHGDAPPDVTGCIVYVLDFSYPREVLEEMDRKARYLRVLDHHKTAQEALSGLDFAEFDMERSGAGMAWDILLSHTGRGRPWLVDYVEDRDLWRFKLPHSKEVNAWIGACRRESFEDWDALNALGVAAAAERGEAVLAFIDRYVHEMTAQARTVEFEGYKIPVVNAPYINTSELVGHLAQSAPFAIGWYHRSDGMFAHSLRSRGPDAVDVSEIAKRYGGGGHRNAAGFATRAPLFL